MSKTIELALKNTVSFDNPDEQRDTLLAEQKRLQGLLANLLPVEVEARKPIESSLKTIDRRLGQISIAEKFPGLKMLEKSVFGWVKEQDSWRKGTFRTPKIVVPRLAYLPVNNTKLVLQIDHNGRTTFEPDGMPQEIADHYRKILGGLRRYLSWAGRQQLWLTYTYTGVVPDNIRAIIREEQQTKRFHDLVFVCEVPQWQVGSIMAPAPLRDPILTGLYGQTLWVLDSFDPTPIEDYLLREFTS